jgi:hypothetical protein
MKYRYLSEHIIFILIPMMESIVAKEYKLAKKLGSGAFG